MAIEIEGPDGEVVEFPDGTDDATIERVMRDSYPATSWLERATKGDQITAPGGEEIRVPPGLLRQWDAAGRGAADFIAAGNADELAAGASAAVAGLLPGGLDFGGAYQRNLMLERARDDADRRDVPIARNAGQVVGFGLSAAAAYKHAPQLFQNAGGWLGNIGRNTAGGATWGAAEGFGDREGGLGDKLAGAGRGAIWGGATGAALSPVMDVAGYGVNAMLERARPLADRAMSQFYRRTPSLDANAMRTRAEEIAQTGVDPTLLDVAGSAGLRGIRAAGIAAPEAGEVFVNNAGRATANTKPAVMDRTHRLVDDPRTTSQMAEDARKARDALATEQYRGPYQTVIPVNDMIRGALADDPGRRVMGQARRIAETRRDYDQLKEIDQLLAPPKEVEAGVVKLPPVATPDPPLPEGDPRGPSLATWLRQQGGLRPDGELSARDWGRDRSGRFQMNNLTSANGMSLDEAAQRAWEAGYFPDVPPPRGGAYDDNYTPVTGEMLLERLQREERGAVDDAWAREEDFAAETRWMDEAPDTLPALDEGYWGSLSEPNAMMRAGTLDRVRIALREAGDEAAAKLRNSEAAGWFGRMEDLDTSLDQVPQLREARAEYRDRSKAIDVLEGKRPDAFSTDPADYARWLESLPQQARDAERAAVRQDILDTLGGQRAGTLGSLEELTQSPYARANLQAVLGPEADSYLANVTERVMQLKNARFVSPNDGSRTAVVQQDVPGILGAAKDVATGNGWGIVTRVADWLTSRGFREGEAEELAKIAVDPARLDEALRAVEARGGAEAAAALKAVLANGVSRYTAEQMQPDYAISVELPGQGIVAGWNPR